MVSLLVLLLFVLLFFWDAFEHKRREGSWETNDTNREPYKRLINLAFSHTLMTLGKHLRSSEVVACIAWTNKWTISVTTCQLLWTGKRSTIFMKSKRFRSTDMSFSNKSLADELLWSTFCVCEVSLISVVDSFEINLDLVGPYETFKSQQDQLGLSGTFLDLMGGQGVYRELMGSLGTLWDNLAYFCLFGLILILRDSFMTL